MDDKRTEKKLPGCLILSKEGYPNTKILVCGLCPNKSNMIKNLGEDCVRVPKG